MLDGNTLCVGPGEDHAAFPAAPAQRVGRAGGVLLASTTWWAFPARLASACAARGVAVHAVCGPDHPIAKTRATAGIFPYAPLRPLRALEHAITASQAALVLPCDDRARVHLHKLYAATQDLELRGVIAHSLGDPASFPVVERRSALISAALSAGIDAPETVPVPDAHGLEDALLRIGLPAVLKVDGTWGGLGVAVVRTVAQAKAAFTRFARPLSAMRAAKRLMFDRDAFDLPLFLSGETPRISLQRYVHGRPANSLSICRDGRVLRTICAESLLLQRPLGAAAVVRVIEHPGMRVAAENLARSLGISGFLGLDFLIDEAGGAARLVEMNARGTPLAHLCFGEDSDLVGGIAELAGCHATQARPRTAPQGIVAYFPQAQQAVPGTFYLHEGLHDVPWEEPELVRELMRLPRPDRSVLAQALRRVRQVVRVRDAAPGQTQWDVA